MRPLLLTSLALLAACGEPLPRSLPPPQPGLMLPDPLRAVGTEPFWAAIVEKDVLTYKTPENQVGTRVAVTRQAIGDSVVIRGLLNSRTLILVIRRGPCSDGMSDTVYPYAVSRSLGEDVQHGCARS